MLRGSHNCAGRRWRVGGSGRAGVRAVTCLRSNVIDWTPEQLWRAYVQLTEAEAALRVHKSDLQIRPVWHRREHRVGAHILVCFLACVLWKTLAASCQQARDSVTSPSKGLKSSRRLLWSMWCCPRAVVWSYGSAALVNRPSTNGSCCNVSRCGCPQR